MKMSPLTPSQEAVLAELRSGGIASATELADLTGLDYQKALRILHGLYAMRLVERQLRHRPDARPDYVWLVGGGWA